MKIQMWLTVDSAEVRAKLKALGFEASSQVEGAKYLVGNLPAGQLGALSKLTEVKFASLAKQ